MVRRENMSFLVLLHSVRSHWSLEEFNIRFLCRMFSLVVSSLFVFSLSLSLFLLGNR